jgi:hypothetical protein
MSVEDWIFAVHLLFAATLVGSLVMSWIVIVSLRTAETPGDTLGLNRVAMVATGATIVGLAGTIGLGVWLAVLRVAFHPWDGWVIAAIVLWGIATTALVCSFGEHGKAVRVARTLSASAKRGASAELAGLNRSSRGLVLRALGSGAVVLIVIDMIWKPGA